MYPELSLYARSKLFLDKLQSYSSNLKLLAFTPWTISSKNWRSSFSKQNWRIQSWILCCECYGLQITSSIIFPWRGASDHMKWQCSSIVLDILEKERWTHDGECQQPDGCAQTRRGTGRASWELRTRIPPSAGCAEPTKCSTSSWKKSLYSIDYRVIMTNQNSI